MGMVLADRRLGPVFKRMDPSPRHVNLTPVAEPNVMGIHNMSPFVAGPNGTSVFGDIIVRDPRPVAGNVRGMYSPRGAPVVGVGATRNGVLLTGNGASMLDFGPFRGFEGIFFGEGWEADWTGGADSDYVSPYPNDPIQTNSWSGSTTGGTPSTESAFDWTKLFDPVAKVLVGVTGAIAGAVAAGQRNPATGLPYTQAQADAYNRAMANQNSGLSPLMIGGIAVLGIGTVLLLMNRRSSAAPALSGYGKRKRRRFKRSRR